MHGVHPAPNAMPTSTVPDSRGLVGEMDAPVLRQHANIEDAEQIQTESDDERATDPRDPHARGEEHATEYTCGGAERDEYE